MRPALVLLALIALSMWSPEGARAQALLPATAGLFGSADSLVVRRGAVAIPDSTREKVGYHHWKGGAIGGAAGGVAGLLLVLAAGRACNDCSSGDTDVLVATTVVLTLRTKLGLVWMVLAGGVAGALGLV